MPGQLAQGYEMSPKSPRHSPGGSTSIGRSHSLDGVTADIATDSSGSVEEYDVSQELSADCCSGHEHFEIPIIDEVIKFHVDTMFDMIFGDHEFYTNFHNIKKTTKLVLTDWSDVNEEGDKTRTITYTIAVNNALGPKTANTTEKQFWKSTLSKPGQNYVVDAECYTAGVPYSENFYLINRFCFNKITDNSSQLKITSRIVYTKKVWGFVKGFIDKNVKSGTLESYILIARLLKQESENSSRQKYITPSPSPSPNTITRQRKKVLKKKRSKTDILSENHLSRDSDVYSVREVNNNLETPATRRRRRAREKRCSRSREHRGRSQYLLFCTVRVETLAQVVCALLFVLAALHFLLFYKLRALEETAVLLTEAGKNMWEKARAPVSVEELWKPLLQSQDDLHTSERDKWRDVLSASAKVMAGMQRTLLLMETDMADNGHLGQTESPSQGG